MDARACNRAAPTPATLATDSITAYLASPPVHPIEIKWMGGLLGYWTFELNRGSPLARMALGVLTSPGKFRLVCSSFAPLIYVS